ncbi:MAG: hypothetical protein DRI34_04540 [Deltaproteobacteria bacterium]|nr:MAG: hypothetical protein DRI34_04540 [Deltaproteobacteria bacterium]
MASQAKMMEVYTVVDKAGSEKSFWVRIGACFTNRDGSFSVLLDALPTNGKLQIRQRNSEQTKV